MKRHLRFQSAEETTDFAKRLAPALGAGDVILLHGDLGAGKTHFARAVIQARMAIHGVVEEIPSPTFTLVQTYPLRDADIWHADLYRLSGVDDVFELGLDEAFHTAICLVEWPDRLAETTPANALSIEMTMTETLGERLASFDYEDSKWSKILNEVLDDG